MHSRLGIWIFFYQTTLALFYQMQDLIGMSFTGKFMTRGLSNDSLLALHDQISIFSIYVMKLGFNYPTHIH